MRPIGTLLLSLVLASPAFAQSPVPSKPVDQSIAGNTQQAAGQLAEINKKLGLILERMDALASRRSPLIVPATIRCAGSVCDQTADTLCEKMGYRRGEVIGRGAGTMSSWMCLDSVGPK